MIRKIPKDSEIKGMKYGYPVWKTPEDGYVLVRALSGGDNQITELGYDDIELDSTFAPDSVYNPANMYVSNMTDSKSTNSTTNKLVKKPVINRLKDSKYPTDFIRKREGGVKLKAYIPLDNDGKVFGKSGVTAASGFDMGQWNDWGLKHHLKLKPALVKKITPLCT